jgi:hypothetical protein
VLALSGERLLAVWDRARDELPLLRPIALLAAAMPGSNDAQLVQLSIVQRDRLLLQLRQISFGPTLAGHAACSLCGAAMEFSLAVADALAGLEQADAPATLEESADDPRMRLSTTADLLAAVQEPTPELAERRLLARCTDIDDLTSGDIAGLPAVRARFDRLHALAELHCNLVCPQCAHEATWCLDVAHFVWLETQRAAQRLLADIHALALHYGWSERAIARMHPHRRDFYLEMLGS